jgi:hypothetical protein
MKSVLPLERSPVRWNNYCLYIFVHDKQTIVGLYIAVLSKCLLEALLLQNIAYNNRSFLRDTSCPNAAKPRHIALGLRLARTAFGIPIAYAS